MIGFVNPLVLGGAGFVLVLIILLIERVTEARG